MFLEDYVFNYGIDLRGPALQVWARQLNTENRAAPGVPNIIVAEGASLWMLGLKTEMPTTVLSVRDGGRAEVLGAYVNPIIPCDSHTPAFSVENGEFAFTGAFREMWGRYELLVESFLATGTARWRRSTAGESHNGNPVVALYVVRAGANLPTVRLRTSSSVGNGAPRFTLSRTGDVGAPLTVGLTSTDGMPFSLPAEVTLPAGQHEVTVAATPQAGSVRLLDVALSGAPERYVLGREGSVTVVPATVADPPPVNDGLVQYLAPSAAFTLDRVDDGYRVRTWPDASGRGHSAEAGGEPLRPFLTLDGPGGRPALRFSKSFLQFRDDPDLNAAPGGYNAKTLAWVLRTGSQVDGRQLLHKQGGNTRGFNLYIDGGLLYFHVFNRADGGWGQIYVKSPITPATDYSVIAGFDGATGRIWLRVNGVVVEKIGAHRLPAHNAPAVSAYTASFGGLQGGALPIYHDGLHTVRYGVYFDGLMGGLLHYNRALTNNETQAIDAWLRRGFAKEQ